MIAPGNTIYTIGHSNRTAAFFIEMLRSFDVRLLADVRSMPGSKWVPQFNSRALAHALGMQGIKYVHYPALGGRTPKVSLSSAADMALPFSQFSQYMETKEFIDAIQVLQHAARKESTAYMCAEADWRQCHRAKISAYLAMQGWQVVHIMDMKKSVVHSIAHEDNGVQGRLF